MLWPVVKEEQIRWQRIGTRWQRIGTMFLSKYQKNVLSLYKIGCTRPLENKFSWLSLALSLPTPKSNNNVMRNICFAAALLLCLQVYGAKAESMDSHTTYLNYKVATSNGQGSRRCPANLAFLPSTWIDETRLYMKWRCNLGTVNIYVTDAVGHVVLRNIANCNFGEVTSWDISFWATNIYTLFIMVGENSYYDTFSYNASHTC